MYICIYKYICARVCICVCMYIYVYTYDICIYVCKYVHVCMWTLVDVIEGPYHPLRFGRRGCCFYKSENTESEWYTASTYGLVDLQLPHSSDRGYHIPLSVSVRRCILHKWYSHAPQPCAHTVDHQLTTKTRF